MNRRSILWPVVFSTFGAVAVVGVVGARHVALADDAVAPAASAHPPGMAEIHRWLAAALDTVDLRPDQHAQIEQLKSDLQAQATPVKEAHDRVVEAVATSVEAGALDHAAIDPLIVAVKAAAETNRPAFEGAANRLHGILDAGQRAALVTSLRERMMAEHGMHFHGRPDHLAAIGAQIGLTDDQLTTIRAKLDAEPAEEAHVGMRSHFAHMKAIADAFKSESFDAHALGVGNHAQMMSHRVTMMLTHLDAALPVLTAAQRTQLAQLIRARQIGA